MAANTSGAMTTTRYAITEKTARTASVTVADLPADQASADSRAADQELGKQGHGTTGRSLGVARHRGGPCDVQVRPRVRLGEAGEETRRGHRTGRASPMFDMSAKLLLSWL